ncbi:MAG TPA: toll/interleukin-1 receptor domain-containing protein [Nitrospira sp.]|jgi:hypothetical protein|nr:toll/interleukin-1 receptor domain-containing protein [Nitrospira sp.]
MAFRDDNNLLFYKGDLSDALRQQLKSADAAVDELTEEFLVSSSEAVLLEHVRDRLQVAAIDLLEDRATMTREEIKVDVSQNSDRNPFRDPGPIWVPGIKVRIEIPFQGDINLWDFRPSTWRTTFPRGNVRSAANAGESGRLVLVYEFPADETAERIKSVHERNLDDVRFYLTNQRTQITSELGALLDQRIMTAIGRRRARLQRHDNLADVFGVAMKKPEPPPPQPTASPTSGKKIEPRTAGVNPQQQWDVFISHASEDKDEIARPLALELEKNGLRVWFDEFSLKVGDSLRRSIDHGLAKSRFGVVVISPNFLAKEWPQKELDGLTAREIAGRKVILPVWHQISIDQLRDCSPLLADRLATNSSKGLSKVVEDLLAAIH